MILWYTEDAKLFPEDAEIVSGADNIKELYSMPEGVRVVEHKIDPLEIKIEGDHAYAIPLFKSSDDAIPLEPVSRAYLGLSLHAAGKSTEARKALETALAGELPPHLHKQVAATLAE